VHILHHVSSYDPRHRGVRDIEKSMKCFSTVLHIVYHIYVKLKNQDNIWKSSLLPIYQKNPKLAGNGRKAVSLQRNAERSADEPSLFWELLNVVKEGRVLVFAWWCIGAGMCTGVIWNFLLWYTEDLAINSHIEWLKTLQGLMTGVQCFLGELPFNFISGIVLKKLGHVNVMSLVLLTYAIR